MCVYVLVKGFTHTTSGCAGASQDIAVSRAVLVCCVVINFRTCVCIDWLKVSLILVFEVCYPPFALETVQDGRQTKILQS